MIEVCVKGGYGDGVFLLFNNIKLKKVEGEWNISFGEFGWFLVVWWCDLEVVFFDM